MTTDFLITPYRRIKNGKVTDETVWLRADEESESYVAPADTEVNEGCPGAGPEHDRPVPQRL